MEKEIKNKVDIPAEIPKETKKKKDHTEKKIESPKCIETDIKKSVESNKNKVIASEITKKPNESKRKLEELVSSKSSKQATKVADLSDEGADFEDESPKKHSKKEVQDKDLKRKIPKVLEKGKDLS